MAEGDFDLFGLAMGGDTGYDVEAFFGLDGADIRTSAALLPYADGAAVSAAQLAGVREFGIELTVVGADQADTHAKARALAAAMQPRADEGVFVWQLPGEPSPRRLLCRPAGPAVTSWASTLEWFEARLNLEAADPVIYADVEQTVALAPYAGTAFADYPNDEMYPKVYGSGGSGGGTVVTNGGTWPVWPRFEIVGPPAGAITPLTLENVTTGGVVAFDGLSVGVGQTLIVETHPARRVVDFTSGASRLSTVRDLDSWFRLAPGDNELRFRAGGTTEGPFASVTWRDGYL